MSAFQILVLGARPVLFDDVFGARSDGDVGRCRRRFAARLQRRFRRGERAGSTADWNRSEPDAAATSHVYSSRFGRGIVYRKRPRASE